MTNQKYYSGENHPSWRGGRIITDSGYIKIKNWDHPRANPEGYVREAWLMAEKVLKKFLPIGVVVHHINHISTDNRPENLIICQNQGYHLKLHQRERAIKVCGHPHWRKCKYCKQYDDPKNLSSTSLDLSSLSHHECRKKYQKKRYQEKKKVNQGHWRGRE